MELVSRSLFASILWWNSWQLEFLGQGFFRVEGIAKTMFSPKSFSGDSKVDLFVFFVEDPGTCFLTFSALETGLKIKCF